MAVKLRLRRMGKKKQPFYRVVAIDSRVARNGKYIEKIGRYNPLVNPPEIVIDEEKALLWLTRGAIPTDTVKNLLSKKGILLRWHLMKREFPEDKIEEEMKRWELIQIEKSKREEALKVQQERENKKAVDKDVTEEETTEVATKESTKDEVITRESTEEEVATEESTKDEVITKESTEEEVVTEELGKEEALTRESTEEDVIIEESTEENEIEDTPK